MTRPGQVVSTAATMTIPRPRLSLHAHRYALAVFQAAAAELPASPFAGLASVGASLLLGGVEIVAAEHLMPGGFELYADGRLILAGTVLAAPRAEDDSPPPRPGCSI